MKKLLLVSLILLNGCAFDDMMTSVNNSLKNTNQALSGNGQLQSKNKSYEDTDDNIDCDKDSKKFKEWHISQLKNKNSNDKLEKQMDKIQYKLIRYCNDRYANSAYIKQGVKEVK